MNQTQVYICPFSLELPSYPFPPLLITELWFDVPESYFPDGTTGKNLPAIAGDIGDPGSIPGSGKFHGAGNGNPLQYSWG